ncbi:cysteine proteinase [Venturia nashicola]|uniref:Cysteine proteinase n=1 Tax=Venturia nashicola TaxID=86259 RepID=A0A4Z1PK07_9PEZI|nr:cysteine proteinase [Venturia nashicola]
MDDILAKHRKEQRDLQSVITQKKKAASKKTRKGINEECTRLEQHLQSRQEEELAALNGNGKVQKERDIDSSSEAEAEDPPSNAPKDDPSVSETTEKVSSLNLSEELPTSSPTHPSQSSQTTPGTGTAGKKRNRQKDRLARRAAELADTQAQAEKEALEAPDLRSLERERMNRAFTDKGLVEKEVRADGHCLYASVADQLDLLGVGLRPSMAPKIAREGEGEAKAEPYRVVRKTAAKYIKEHENDFLAFLEEPVDEYVWKVGETGEWGGQLELLALAKAYGVSISVLDGNGQVHEVDGANQDEEKRIWLAYYRHGFGLGEHYNSLRKR